jgi:hypothetical protein
MICPTCHGQPLFPPCDDCGGFGLVHCCEGLRASMMEDDDQQDDHHRRQGGDQRDLVPCPKAHQY